MRKNKYIETQNVFLDASIFEEQNFMNSTKIHSLFFYAQTGAIQIHSTTISKKELYNRIEKRITESKSEFKKLTKTFNHKNARIAKNIGFYKSVSIPEINVKNHTAELIKKMDDYFKRSNVNTIRTSNIPITEIVDNYYNKKPPFHNSGKQNEFIDAIILKSLELWCDKNDSKMYVLSKDNDWLGYKSNNLLISGDLSVLLENISKYYNTRYKLNKITSTKKIIAQHKEDLELVSIDLINENVLLTSESIDISNYEIITNKLDSYRIISFRPDRTEVECIFKCSLRFFVFDDNDFTEKPPRRHTFDINVPIYVEISKTGKLDIKWLVENSNYRYEE
ncbi:hypothetical protein SAMN05216480_11458 [Pustulibacterium marinum]|uniref:DUF4935 domain-containing protein n=1 Tax=Pustulibacterium marinum TaxID=1224947 RepID=A0A1I7IBH8_9FLAO|nr:PIN domain-containing protein [Pustulibacterium marinum]SFU70186.1 hypothetical protein SAMN05216480_11458 [Pustulibacterium marinum]